MKCGVTTERAIAICYTNTTIINMPRIAAQCIKINILVNDSILEITIWYEI